MTVVIKIFDAKKCSVNALSGNRGESSKTLVLNSVEMFITYSCKLPADQDKPVYRTEQSGTEHYTFNCGNASFKFYASGFDRFSDGKYMHWDSQGTSQELPWAPIPANDQGHIAECFSLLCQ